jgi:hypothetical protein
MDVISSKLASTFIEDLKNAESRFGQLPEYWELRAFFDLRQEDEARARIKIQGFTFMALTNFDLPLNPLMLQKALDINPNLAPVQWTLGRIEALEAASTLNETIRRDRTIPKGRQILIDAAERAAISDPSNGFYPFIEAIRLLPEGDVDKALQLLEAATNFEKFEYPLFFPQSYFLEHLDDLAKGKGAFKNLSFTQASLLLVQFDLAGLVAFDSEEVKYVYNKIINEALTKDDWRNVFTVLHRAAAHMGRCRYSDLSNSLVAKSLMTLCQQGALKIAIEKGDRDLEIAMVILGEETDFIRRTFKMTVDISSPTLSLLTFGLFMDAMPAQELKDEFAKAFGAGFPLREFQEGLLQDLVSKRGHILSQKYLWPIFESLETFDFANPRAWYDARLNELFPPEK